MTYEEVECGYKFCCVKGGAISEYGGNCEYCDGWVDDAACYV